MTESQQTLKKCPECASMVPMEARKCAHCGYTFVHRSNIGAPIIMIFAVFAVAIAIFGRSAGEAIVVAVYLGAGIIIIRLIRRGRQQEEEPQPTEGPD